MSRPKNGKKFPERKRGYPGPCDWERSKDKEPTGEPATEDQVRRLCWLWKLYYQHYQNDPKTFKRLKKELGETRNNAAAWLIGATSALRRYPNTPFLDNKTEEAARTEAEAMNAKKANDLITEIESFDEPGSPYRVIRNTICDLKYRKDHLPRRTADIPGGTMAVPCGGERHTHGAGNIVV